jgi:cation-transporting ATPase 13A3/4/5
MLRCIWLRLFDLISLHLKGAPEKMRDMCTPDSIPANFAAQLTEYTQCGYRVIALAGKPLEGLSWDEV